MIKKFTEFNKLDEDLELAQPMVKPTTPVTKPSTRPGRPSPYRKDRPSVIPKPKASAEDLADKFLNITKNDKDVKSFLKEKYFKKESVNGKIIESIEEKDDSIKIKTKNQTFKVEYKDKYIHISNTKGGGFIYVKNIEDLGELYTEVKKMDKK